MKSKIEIATTTTKYQVVIPKKIRVKHKIKPGTKLAFIDRGNEVVIKPFDKNYFSGFAGILKGKGDLIKELLKEKEFEKNL